MHIPAPRTGTLQEYYGGWEGFAERVCRDTGRRDTMVVVINGQRHRISDFLRQRDASRDFRDSLLSPLVHER
jgi:hypothetical protein